MKFIKSYDYFIKEELISGPEKSSIVVTRSGKQKMNFSGADINMFTKIFNSDPLKLKEFLQDKLRNLNIENLKFISGGAIGLAFEWKDKVIKVTTDDSEKEGVQKMLSLTSGDKVIPGFAKYYWIEEIDLPESSWKKDDRTFTDEQEEKLKKQRLNKKGVLLTPEEIESRKSISKITKAYVICLDKIRVLDEDEKEIAFALFMLFRCGYLKAGESDDKLKDKMNKFYQWVLSNEDYYQEDEYIKNGFDKKFIFSGINPGISKITLFGTKQNESKFKPKWINFGEYKFTEFSNQLIVIHKTGSSLGIPTSDLHQDNLGYRVDSKELVAFDCM
jgi:hypothetical protein